ncbi:uncharacterized protein ISCGN_020075 [Ixodes scapularis]
MCSWPKNVPPASVIKLAQSQAPPGNEEEWPLHPVRVFSYCKTYKKAKRKATEGLENSCLESTDVGEPDDGATGKDNTADAPVRLSVPIPPTGLGGACARAPPKRRAPDPPSRAPDPPSSKGWSKESRAPTSPLAERQAPRRRNLEAAEVVEATMSPFQSELLKVLLDVRHEVHLLRQDTAQVLAKQEQLAVWQCASLSLSVRTARLMPQCRQRFLFYRWQQWKILRRQRGASSTLLIRLSW